MRKSLSMGWVSVRHLKEQRDYIKQRNKRASKQTDKQKTSLWDKTFPSNFASFLETKIHLLSERNLLEFRFLWFQHLLSVSYQCCDKKSMRPGPVSEHLELAIFLTVPNHLLSLHSFCPTPSTFLQPDLNSNSNFSALIFHPPICPSNRRHRKHIKDELISQSAVISET